MASQKLELQFRGLYTAPNNLSGIPQGALSVADNIVIEAKNLISSRRGQTQYGTPLNVSGGQVNKIFNYSSSLIVNYDSKMAYDSGNGNWIDYSGTYLPPQTGLKMRSLEALKNFYFTTSAGIYKLDSLTGTPKLAGAEKALGGTGATTGSSGFLPDDSAVAYRLVWGYRDANQNLVLGAPSQRVIVANSTGGNKDVSLTFLIPDSITTDYFYQIYRSTTASPATAEPDDEMQLVIEAKPTSGEIAARQFTTTDSTPDSLKRAALYTNPSQEGIANQNSPPPFAVDMDVFKNCAFYANIKQKQSLSLAIIAVSSPALGFAPISGDLIATSVVVTGIASTSDLRAGMRVIGAGIAANTTITSIDSSNQITLSAPATISGTGVSLECQDRLTVSNIDFWAGSTEDATTNTFKVFSGPSPGLNIDDTARSLVDIINISSTNTAIYAYYVSGVEDLPGQILFEERQIGGNQFYATSTAGNSFSPVLSSSGTNVASSNDERQNRVLISKPGQVESVPVYRFFDIGSANFPIQKVVALRDGIFFFKQDGIYRISGETFENFVVTLLDNTVALAVPESAVPFNNQVFCFTTQGIVAVTDSGVRLMSIPIENVLLELSSEQFVNFKSASFGVAYESSRNYMFFTVSSENDTFATQAFVYNSLTDSWSRWLMNRTCGIVNPTLNKLFMAQADTGQILIERKTYTANDYADEQYAIIINSIDSATQFTLADATAVSVGMTLVQGILKQLVVDVDQLANTVTVASTENFQPGAAIVYTPIQNRIQWTPIDVENPGILKQFSEVTFMFKAAAFQSIDATFATNVSTSGTTVPIANNPAVGGWGTFSWGGDAWGGAFGSQSVLRTYVPRDKQRGSWLDLSLRTEEAFTGFSLQGVSVVFNPMSTRIR